MYHRIAGNLPEGDYGAILPPLLSELRNGPEYQFLQRDEAFQALLWEYQAKL